MINSANTHENTVCDNIRLNFVQTANKKTKYATNITLNTQQNVASANIRDIVISPC